MRSQRLRALAVTSVKRSPVLPDLPAVAELGYLGFDAITWYGVFVPAGTPAAVITRLHGEFNPVLSSANFKSWLFNQGSETAPSSPEELHTQVKRERVLYAPIIKKSGMKAD